MASPSITILFRNLLFIVILGIYQQSFAQSDLRYFDYLTITEGLPHNTVFCLMQDKHGFIWAGTKDGLVRFDGYGCKIFRQTENDTSYFQGKSIHAILEDSKGNLWVGTQTKGINFRDYKTGIFRNLQDNPLFNPISKKWINCFFEDKKGQIWIGTIGAGLWCFNPTINQMRHFDRANSQLRDNNISNITQDENGRIWVAASGNGIYFFDKNETILTQIHATEANDTDFASFRKTFFPDKKGNLWVGTEGSGLYQVNLATLKTHRYSIRNGLTSNNIMSIAQNKKGEFLLATDGGGLNIFDAQTGKFSAKMYGKNQGNLNSNALFSVLIDHDENVWIGTFNGGINISKAHKTHFESFTQTGKKAGELSHRSVLSVCQSKSNQIYIGTDGGGLNTFNKVSKTFSLIPNQPVGYGSVVKSIFEDAQKQIWLGYFENGLSVFDPQNRRFKHFRHNPNDPTSIGENNVWSITQDQTGKIWVGTLGGGLARLDDKEKGQFKRFGFQPNNSSSLSSNDVIVVFNDRADQLWVGTDTEGLNLFNKKTESFIRFQHQKGNSKSLSANDVRCIFQDSKGRLWIGTESGGLNLWLGNGNFEHFTSKNGLISNAIMDILEDKEGFLWLSTFKGVSRFSVDTKQCLNYDFNKNSYFNANQFNQASGVKDKGGTILFGGINGLTLIKPEEIRILEKKPQLVFTDFKILSLSIPSGKLSDGRIILEKSLEETSEVHLSHNDNAFSFEFAALDFTDPLKNQYAYKMDGFDKNWRTTSGEQRLVTYTNLEPKTYIFRVKGSNNNGVWSNEKTIKIIIDPPFWQTWWFKSLIIASLLGLAWLALHIYTARREMVLKQKVLESDHSILKLKNENLVAEKTILSLQKEKLANDIELKNSELVSKAMQMAHKKEMLEDLKEQIENIKNAKDTDKGKLLSNLKSALTTEIEGENSWHQFLFYFDQINQNFTTELLNKHPSLTQNDLRMCALTRLNMSNKEKAVLLNITVTGVEKSRYRLKKRLHLNSDDNLGEYLRSF
jgi:ligand-binding sensor domain-containing protein/DNA-binding CsgD family transcriptional regulator